MLNEGNQIHNFISSSGSDFLTSYSSGSASYGSYGFGSATLLNAKPDLVIYLSADPETNLFTCS